MAEGRITKWCADLKDNMLLKEDREIIIWHVDIRQAAMEYCIRALANPNCEGSDMVLAAIEEHRKKLLTP